MKLNFLTKDVDKNLLILITFFLILFIVFTVYYESNLRNLLDEKKQNDELLGEITARAVMDKLNESVSSKELALIDKAVLEEKYSELLVQFEVLNKEKEKLQKELTLAKSSLEYQEVKIDGPVAQFRLIQSKNEQINGLKAQIEAICKELAEDDVSVEGCS
ncbi:hypothetical protein CMO83_02985 [Candidatus Woesearchaeota archaeon]|jgi:hypothetical protein|nr:hypothetical protein [Candidatus Woesearchaeota archaeon]|tara:strand:- start:4239 stop:4721 length:483 start_codon:yes stop_codon:yes gene_type:complete